MNHYSQHPSLLLGSDTDIASLAEQDETTLLIVSDSHGAYYTLHSIVEQEGKGCGALIFCGDGISDLIQLVYDAATDDFFAQCLPPVICFIQGNNDFDIFPMKDLTKTGDLLSAPKVTLKVPLTQTITVSGHNIFVTHGHRHSLYSGVGTLSHSARNLNCEAALYGHTHIAAAQLTEDGIIALNPGSCARPRGCQPPCFAKMYVNKNMALRDYSFREFSPSGCKPYKPQQYSW